MGPPRQCQLFERGEKPEEQRPESPEPGGRGHGPERRTARGQGPESSEPGGHGPEGFEYEERGPEGQ